MDRQVIVEKVKQLDLPAGSYVVFGSAALTLVGLREATDIDIFVTSEAMDELEARGWQRTDMRSGNRCLTHDVFDIYDIWEFGDYSPAVAEVLATATVVDDIPFASLAETRKWKAAFGRPKDLQDIERIDEYLRANPVGPPVS